MYCQKKVAAHSHSSVPAHPATPTSRRRLLRLSVVERAPIPPYERTWLHPSEVAAAERAQIQAETPPRRLSHGALATALFSVACVAVCVAAVTVLTAQQETPHPVSQSLTEPRYHPVVAALGAPTTAPTQSVAIPPLATPVADIPVAVVTLRAAGSISPGDRLAVRWPTGGGATTTVTEVFGAMVVVHTDHPVSGYAVASSLPQADDIVYALSREPVAARFREISALNLPEGTPVIDRHGSLVALCTRNAPNTNQRYVSVSWQTFTGDD